LGAILQGFFTTAAKDYTFQSLPILCRPVAIPVAKFPRTRMTTRKITNRRASFFRHRARELIDQAKESEAQAIFKQE
jgi:hypothetical protein